MRYYYDLWSLQKDMTNVVDWARDYFNGEKVNFDEIIFEEASKSTYTYNMDLAEWAFNNAEHIDEYVSEFGYNGSFFDVIQGSQVRKIERELMDNIQEVKLLYAYDFLVKNGKEQITENQKELIEDFVSYAENSEEIEEFCNKKFLNHTKTKTRRQ